MTWQPDDLFEACQRALRGLAEAYEENGKRPPSLDETPPDWSDYPKIYWRFFCSDCGDQFPVRRELDAHLNQCTRLLVS